MRSIAFFVLGVALVYCSPACAMATGTDCPGLLPPTAVEAARRPITPLDLVQLRDFGGALGSTTPLFSISPDGKRIALILSRAEPDANVLCIGVVVLGLADGAPKLVDVQRGSDSARAGYAYSANLRARNPIYIAAYQAPLWSLDGTAVAFLKRTDAATQVWVAKADGSASRAITDSPVDVESFAWGEEGRTIIFASRPSLRVELEEIANERLSGFHIDQRFRVLPPNGNQRVPSSDHPLAYMTTDLTGTIQAPASPAEIARLKARSSPQDSFAQARRGESGATALLVREQPEFAASRRRLRAESKAGAEIPCARDMCRNASAFWWLGPDLYYTRREGWASSRTAFYRWRPGRGAPLRILDTDDVLVGCQLLERKLLCAHEGATSPRRLVAIDLPSGLLTKVFDPNPQAAQWIFGQVERLHWRSDSGTETFGDLVLPADHRPGQRHPLIVVTYESRGFLRGGTGDEYPIQAFAARGFAVLSFHRPADVGYTDDARNIQAVERANLDGFADRRNVQSSLHNGVQLLVARGLVDPARIGITGMSEGSAIAQWALFNSNIFAAAAISSGPMGQDVMAFGGTAAAKALQSYGYPRLVDKDENFWRPLSLDLNIQTLKTPVLYNLPESEYLLAVRSAAIARELEKPLDLFVFPDEQHFKWQPAHRYAIYRRNLDWFDFWLRGVESNDPDRREDLLRWREWRDADPSRTKPS